MKRRFIPWAVALLFILLATSSAVPKAVSAQGIGWRDAVIYYSEGCADCGQYTTLLYQTLKREGVTRVTVKEFFYERANLAELIALNQRLGVPQSLWGHLEAFVDDTVVLMGHVPVNIVSDLLRKPESYQRILIFQDEMHTPTNYKAWAFQGQPKEYSLNTPISEYLKGLKPEQKEEPIPSGTRLLLPTVLTAGLLDGVNPCAFAVLAFLMAFLFTIRRVRGDIFKVGAIYAFSIFATYFLLGVGLMRVFSLPGQPHLIGTIGAFLVMALGIYNFKDLLFPRLGLPSLSMPGAGWEKVKGYIYRATLPSTIVVGFLVGLCTLPCSGGIYVATLGLLTAKTTYLTGLGYLFLYNLAYIAPLVGALVITSNRVVAKRLAVWERLHTAQARALFGGSMIALGLVILVWLL